MESQHGKHRLGFHPSTTHAHSGSHGARLPATFGGATATQFTNANTQVESRSHRLEVAVVNSPVAKSRDEECRNRLCQTSHHGTVPGTRECTSPKCRPLNEIRTTYRVCTSPRPRRHSHLAGLLRGSFAPTGQKIYRNTRLRRALSDWPQHSAPLTSDVLCTTANPYRDPCELSVAAPKSKLHTGSFLTTDTRPRAACGKGSPRRCLDLSYSNLKFAPAGGFGRPLGIRCAYGPFTGDSHPTYTSEPRHTHSYQLQVQVNGIRARRVRNSSRYPTNPKFTAIKEKAEHSERRYRGLVTSLCCLEYCVLDSLRS